MAEASVSGVADTPEAVEAHKAFAEGVSPNPDAAGAPPETLSPEEKAAFAPVAEEVPEPEAEAAPVEQPDNTPPSSDPAP